MTKSIHVVNGDTSAYKVNVLVQDKVYVPVGDGKGWPEWNGEWKTVETLPLDNAGQLLTKYVTSSRRLVIEENGSK